MRTIPITGEKQIKKCNGCTFCDCGRMGPASIYYVFKCKYRYKVSRILKTYADKDDEVERPADCPLIQTTLFMRPSDENTSNKENTSNNENKDWSSVKERAKRLAKWKSLKGITEWDDIKVGNDYHLPPTMDKPRMDVHVVSKMAMSITCKILGRDNASITLYNSGHEYKFMKLIKKKVQS